MSEPKGIDVSNRNGQFNWTAWEGHISFASAKATEGIDFKDPEFARNWEMMERMGIFRWAYHYGHPFIDPAEQAWFFTDFVKSLGLHKGDNFELDLEETDGLSPVEVSFWAWTFCTEVNRLAPGHRCQVYTYPAFAEQGNCAKLAAWPLRIANWGVPVPFVPAPWDDWEMWQESCNVTCKDVFNGTQEDLEVFCTTTGHSR